MKIPIFIALRESASGPEQTCVASGGVGIPAIRFCGALSRSNVRQADRLSAALTQDELIALLPGDRLLVLDALAQGDQITHQWVWVYT
jgi:hypothetical protein